MGEWFWEISGSFEKYSYIVLRNIHILFWEIWGSDSERLCYSDCVLTKSNKLGGKYRFWQKNHRRGEEICSIIFTIYPAMLNHFWLSLPLLSTFTNDASHLELTKYLPKWKWSIFITFYIKYEKGSLSTETRTWYYAVKNVKKVKMTKED